MSKTLMPGIEAFVPGGSRQYVIPNENPEISDAGEDKSYPSAQRVISSGFVVF